MNPQSARDQRLAREAAAIAADKAPPLEPPFPYRQIAFDPWAFHVETDPEPVDIPSPAT